MRLPPIALVAAAGLTLVLLAPAARAADVAVSESTWVDHDGRPIRQPKIREKNLYAHQFREAFTEPLSHGFDVPDKILWLTRQLTGGTKPQSVNVNAFDEVGNSSWFTNRNHVRSLTPAEVRRGGDKDDIRPKPPYVVKSYKKQGVNPGFNIKDANGKRWVVKLDPVGHPQIGSGADAVVTRLLFASGYNVPHDVAFTFRRDELVIDGMTQRDDLAGGCHDAAAADHRHAFLVAGFCDTDDPRGVLVRGALHHEMVVEVAQTIVIGCRWVVNRRVVADAHELDALQAQRTVRLGPPTVVADEQAHDAAVRAAHGEAIATDVEIALLEMLKSTPGFELVVARQVHLVIAVHDRARAVDEDRGVEVRAGRSELRVSEHETDAESLRLVEQRLCVRAGHRSFEKRVDLGLLGHGPSREERGERELGEHHEVAPTRMRVAQQRQQPFDDIGAGMRSLHGPELRGADGHDAGHGSSPWSASASSVCNSTSAPASRSAASVDSAGLCDKPLMLGTKIIAAGHTRASICAS